MQKIGSASAQRSDVWYLDITLTDLQGGLHVWVYDTISSQSSTVNTSKWMVTPWLEDIFDWVLGED